MPDLLLELFSEEIPARMQAQGAADLQRLVTEALVERGLVYEGAQSFATPRRLTLHLVGLPARQPDTREERKGPRVGAPEGAIQGFLKSAGLSAIEQATISRDPKKGDFYTAVIERPGGPTAEVIGAVLPGIVKAFPWPKSMRWGAGSSAPEPLRWVRPLHSILCTFGPETEEPEVVRFSVDGIAAGDTTRGHRFMAPEMFRVKRFDDYVPKLERARVVLDPERRRNIIRHDARNLAFAQGLELIEDEALLAEVAGLVEWPVVLLGRFDEAFLAMPAEVIRATIRANQKCFVTRGPDGTLADRFVLVSNIVAPDGGAAIVAGNERVVRARLSDAKFFWEQDLAVPLADRVERLDRIVFHEKLGTQGDRVRRIAALARELAPLVGADPDEAERAATLAKADLVTEMVGEFPELQGFMGRRYAERQGESPAVSVAIEDHYKPQGPSDRVPSEPVSIAVALADKLDTLVGFWAIDEKPTGSKDPFALRRAALGVIRLVLDNDVHWNMSQSMFQSLLVLIATSRVVVDNDDIKALSSDQGVAPLDLLKHIAKKSPLEMLVLDYDNLLQRAGPIVDGFLEPIYDDLSELEVIRDERRSKTQIIESQWLEYEDIEGRQVLTDPAREAILNDLWEKVRTDIPARLREIASAHDLSLEDSPEPESELEHALEHFFRRPKFGSATPNDFPTVAKLAGRLSKDLLAFFADRLKVYLREKGARYDLIDAVFALPGQDDLLMIVRRVEALGRFLDTEDGVNLLAGHRRAANILRAEKKKDGAGAFDGAYDSALLVLTEEQALAKTLARAEAEAAACVEREDFEGAMRAMAQLRAPVDAFFDKVTVNADDPPLRLNRLRLLDALRRATLTVADFSKVGG